ncbi:unnamed protein product [Heligmosomoides polygyrus]|uniref:NADH-quinone oxidoreductase subunit I n=1 Tax=Heligmosomoides polygyrus TaxID=6339 RepID=A0A183F2Q8_HELPZ|nr:unnamed protein product [Heligmosomoides polygyrus]
MSDDQIRLMEYPEQEELEFRERIRMIRREVGAYLEHYTKRNLGFDYEKPFKRPGKETPNHKFRQTL